MQPLLMDIGFVQPLLQAFCRMLVHSLWLGLLLTVVTGIVVLCTRRSSSVLRYNLLTVLLFVFLGCCSFMFIRAWMQASVDSPVTGYAPVVMATAWQSTVMLFCSEYANYITTVWLVFFVFKCWQMTLAFRYVKKISTRGHRHAGDQWNEKIQALARQLQVKQTVRLLESAVTKVPVVIGHLKPVVYMPVGLLTNLPADQVEAVLLHELAHIRRRDYLANLLQHIAESIFFFNPGLLWICSLLRREREHCCDDMALQLVARKKPFLEALVKFREYALNDGAYTMAFPGSTSHLLQRVTRIVNNRNTALTKAEKIFFTASVVVLLLFPRFRSHHIAATTPSQEPVAATGLVVKDTMSVPAPAQPAMRLVAPEKKMPKRAERMARKRTVRASMVQTSLSQLQRVEPSIAIEEHILLEKARMQDEQLRKLAALDEHRREEVERMVDREKAKEERNRERTERNKRQLFDQDRRRADQERQRIETARKQGERNRRDADRDRERAERDHERAEKQKERAEQDKRQAEENRRHAEQLRRQAISEHRVAVQNHQRIRPGQQQNASQYRWQMSKEEYRTETSSSYHSSSNSSSDKR